ncbi:hypothetical protein ILYODFUR_033645 [Ilyodon furcidens]|uniref:Uncharacterized protein n=1 Tax=Ilyodon furcidens TaxID=33524 RepID=A0ABV0UPZ0_9TELE
MGRWGPKPIQEREQPKTQPDTKNRSRCQYPIRTTSPWTQEVVPFPPGVETGTPPQHLNLVWPCPGSCLNLNIYQK